MIPRELIQNPPKYDSLEYHTPATLTKPKIQITAPNLNKILKSRWTVPLKYINM